MFLISCKSHNFAIILQFSSMTNQGTRIVIYNLWDDDQGELELDFDADQHVCLVLYTSSY